MAPGGHMALLNRPEDIAAARPRECAEMSIVRNSYLRPEDSVMAPPHAHPLTRLGELTFQADDETLAREVRALVDPAATLRLNGRESDVAGYLRHVSELRSAMDEGTITVLDEVGDGASGTVAARVTVRMAMKDGSVVQGESHLIGRLGDDSRITKMVEIGRLLTPDDDPVEASPSKVRPQGGRTQDASDETLFAAIVYVLVSGWRLAPTTALLRDIEVDRPPPVPDLVESRCLGAAARSRAAPAR
ncbi:hypothetical protein SGPA1_20764 [Streptomyces misionensis JCM 4497]